MSGRPVSYINWTPGAGAPIVVPPPSSFLPTGWKAGQAPPPGYMNWAFQQLDQWIQYLDGVTYGGVPDQVMRLLNGGYYSFSATTGAFAWSASMNISIPGIPDTNNVVPAGTVNLLDGQVAYVTINEPIFIQGTTQIGSNIVNDVNFTGNLVDTMAITGAGIPAGTTITGVFANYITISQNATAAGVTSMTCSLPGNLAMQVATNATWAPGTLQILIARRLGNVLYVGVNTGQMTLQDGESKPLLGSGYFTPYQLTAGEALAAGQAVYISPGGAADPGRTAGRAYLLDCSPAHNTVRGTFAGLVITSTGAGTLANILFNGFYPIAGLIGGTEYYADPTTPGGLVPTSPTVAGQKIVPIGFAINANELLVSAGAGGANNANTYPIFMEDVFPNVPAGTTSVNLSTFPLNASAVFVFVDGILLPPDQWTLVGPSQVSFSSPIGGSGTQDVIVKYVLAQQGYLTAQSAVGLNAGDNLNFTFTIIPKDKLSTFVFVDGALVDQSQFSLTLTLTSATVTLASAITPGQEVVVIAMSAAGLIPGVNSLVQGVGVTITDLGNKNYEIAAPGASGGYVAQGSEGSPIIVGASGLTGFGPDRQKMFFIRSPGGAVTVTANPQIAPGSNVGDIALLLGQDDTNYPIFNDGNGLKLNGQAQLKSSEALPLVWTGSVWREAPARTI